MSLCKGCAVPALACLLGQALLPLLESPAGSSGFLSQPHLAFAAATHRTWVPQQHIRTSAGTRSKQDKSAVACSRQSLALKLNARVVLSTFTDQLWL